MRTSSLKTKRIKTAKAILEIIELSETKRVRYNTDRNTATQHDATLGCIATTIPNKVATPFPPLKFAQIGKM